MSWSTGANDTNTLTTGFLDTLPEILRDAVTEQVPLEVYRHALEELVYANIYREHAKDYKTLLSDDHEVHVQSGTHQRQPSNTKARRRSTTNCQMIGV